jgi:hypothetical protein
MGFIPARLLTLQRIVVEIISFSLARALTLAIPVHCALRKFSYSWSKSKAKCDDEGENDDDSINENKIPVSFPHNGLINSGYIHPRILELLQLMPAPSPQRKG